MKKILILLAVLSFASCKKVSSDSITISKEEYNKLNSGLNIQKYPKPITFQGDETEDLAGESGIVLGSDGHEYLSSYSRSERGLTHYVDCELCVQRRIDFENSIITALINNKKDTLR